MLTITALVTLVAAAPASAGHNGADVGIETTDCGATTFTASVLDPGGTHVVSNMYLVVDVDGVAQSAIVPVDGSETSIAVGPFYAPSAQTQTISWRVWGGGERDYDDPSFDGYGDPGFGTAIVDYANDVGGYGWVIAGTDDPNPFTNWHGVDVAACVIDKEMCKKGGYADFGFSNQGRCIRFANTGKDSR